MKKLIIAAAIVCAATISEAAAVGWSCAGANAYADGSYSIFVIGKNGVMSAAQIEAIVAAGGLSSASEYAFGGGSVSSTGTANSLNSVSGKSITWTGPGDEVYNAFIFVEDKEGKFASYTDSKSITLANDSTGKNWSFQNQATAFTANKFDVAPEPTSGLLLLIGVAGLALRRRRA